MEAPHTHKWAKRVEGNKRTATLSARKHLKSTMIYAFVMWMIYRMDEGDNLDWLYMSYNQKMSLYHTTNIKILIQANPCFGEIKDLTQGKAFLDYTWEDGSRFRCPPSIGRLITCSINILLILSITVKFSSFVGSANMSSHITP